jgi:hypothetical protein
VLELQAAHSDVVGCYAKPAAFDRLCPTGGMAVRIASNELLLLGERQRLPELEAQLASRDPSSLVVDLSSAFSVWTLRGEERHEAFCRLSQLQLPDPPAVAQGLVAHVPGKVIVLEDELIVLVSSAVAHHFRERLREACADLAPVETVARTLERPAEQAAPA